MRKFSLGLMALLMTFSLLVAGEVTFVKYDKDKKELTVKENDKEVTYKITDSVTVKRGNKDSTVDKATAFFTDKAKEGYKFEITTDKDKLTEIKLKGKGQ